MYLAFSGEVLLMAALSFFIVQGWKSSEYSVQIRLVMILALVFVALTASVGAVRFWGEQELVQGMTNGIANDITSGIVPLHEQLSFWAKSVAMPLYACAAVLLWGAVPLSLVAVFLLLAILPIAGLPALITDVVLVLCLLRLLQQANLRLLMALSLLSILLVPLCSLLIKDRDLAMGLFHAALASHFFCLALAVRWRQFAA